jgi:hypothetical protein
LTLEELFQSTAEIRRMLVMALRTVTFIAPCPDALPHQLVGGGARRHARSATGPPG